VSANTVTQIVTQNYQPEKGNRPRPNGQAHQQSRAECNPHSGSWALGLLRSYLLRNLTGEHNFRSHPETDAGLTRNDRLKFAEGAN
jgi:hypothetical protein